MTPRSLTGVLVLALSVGLSGCANTAGSTDNPPQEASPTADPRDVGAWRPSFTPASDPVSEAEAQQARLNQANQILQVMSLPEYTDSADLPQLIRWVSVEESGEQIAECLTQGGFPSTAIGGAVESEDLAEEQRENYFRLYADCAAQYPIDPRYSRTWGEDQWKIQYEYLIDYYIPCIASFGVNIPEDAIPSEESFVENALYREDMWHPVSLWTGETTEYPELSSTRTEQGAALAKACPQMAPSHLLFGD